MSDLYGDTVYRGVVVVKTLLRDKYGKPTPATVKKHTKPYYRKQVAASMATRMCNNYPKTHIVEKYVEVATAWERL